jgi:hypothetical protein
MASIGQASTQAPQRLHPALIDAWLSEMEMQLKGQVSTHSPHPVHLSLLILIALTGYALCL